MSKKEVQDTVARLLSALAGLGCEFHFESDNRASRHSHYVYVRRPKYIEIRVSDHPANKIKRRKTFDIGPHGMSLEQAVEGITEIVKT